MKLINYGTLVKDAKKSNFAGIINLIYGTNKVIKLSIYMQKKSIGIFPTLEHVIVLY